MSIDKLDEDGARAQRIIRALDENERDFRKVSSINRMLFGIAVSIGIAVNGVMGYRLALRRCACEAAMSSIRSCDSSSDELLVVTRAYNNGIEICGSRDTRQLKAAFAEYLRRNVHVRESSADRK